jgi:cell division protein FtsW
MHSETGNKGIKGLFWNLIDNVKGDKVVWIIVFMLVMISVLAVSSSTSLLVMKTGDRLGVAFEQTAFALGGLAIIWCLCRVNNIDWFRKFSQAGFILSLCALILLVAEIDWGFIKALKINGAFRILKVGGFQVHVFECVKVAMVMYMAWAVHAFKKDKEDIEAGRESEEFRLLRWISSHEKLGFLNQEIWKKVMYFYLPILAVCLLIIPGSNSTAIFLGGILIAILWIGGIPLKEIFAMAAVCLAVLMLLIGIHKVSEGKMFGRVGTLLGRIEADYDPHSLDTVKVHSREFYEILDKIKQPFGAKVAIHEGGLLGKGSGNSTQKYLVPLMYSDYMFSFIIEEYGLWGAFLVIALYVSLLARGSMIARLSDNEYAKIVVGGLSLLITGQAFLHMFVNVDIGPMTGQTLPLVSHGSSAFLMFSIAFGVILSISRMNRERIKKEEEAATPIYEKKEDELQATLQDIEQLERFE